MIKIILIIWLIAIHAFALLAMTVTDLPYRIDQNLGLGQFKPREITQLYRKMVGSHLQLDGSVEAGSTLFLGDSLTQGLNVSAVTDKAINYGIGMDTSFGLLKRVPRYKSLSRVSTVVIAIGINDLIRIDRELADIIDNYKKILRSLPPQANIVMQAIFPVDENTDLVGINEKIIQLNAMLQSLAEEEKHDFLNLREDFIDEDGNLLKELHRGDGLHLSTKGYSRWIDALARHLTSLKD